MATILSHVNITEIREAKKGYIVRDAVSPRKVDTLTEASIIENPGGDMCDRCLTAIVIDRFVMSIYNSPSSFSCGNVLSVRDTIS
jgi:hypothetical protein